MSGHINNANVEPLLAWSFKNQLREAKLNGDLSRFFFRQPIWINSRQRFDQRAFAVIDVTGSRENEVFFCHRSYNWRLATGSLHTARIASTTALSCSGKIVRRSSLKRSFPI